MSEAGILSCVVVAVDGSQESMNSLRWELQNLKLRSLAPDSSPSSFVIPHVQSPPSIATFLNPGAIPFGGPIDLEVPEFTAAIEAHQKRITKVILDHALGTCKEINGSKLKRLLLVDSSPFNLTFSRSHFSAGCSLEALATTAPTMLPVCYLVLDEKP